MGVLPIKAQQTLNVGDTYYCRLSSPPSYLKGCQWTISDIDAMEFVTTPGVYDTSVQVRAIGPQSTSSPVIVHCTYYYMELDPTTGRYIYQRSGYQDWRFYIKDPGPQRIDVTPSNLTMEVGGSSRQLTATAYPSSASSSVTWSVTSGYNVVSVNSNGYVTAKSPGDAVVTATSTINGVSGSCYVHVNKVDPTSISISPSTRQSLAINSSRDFSYTLYPSNATTSVTWSLTGDTYAATLSSSGRLTGKAEGSVRVWVKTANGYSDYCDVDVYKPVPNSISFASNDQNVKMPVGSSRTLSYSVSPSNAIYTVTWASDKEDVATVSSSGRVEAKSPGTAHITVTTDNGKKATSTVVVPPQPTSITVTPAELELLKGRTKQLSYSLLPDNAMARTVTWASSDNSIANVTSSGLVEARRPGTVTITATTDNGKVGECQLTVPVPLFQLFVWMKNGEKTGYLSTEKPLFRLDGDMVKFTTDKLSLDIHKDSLDKFTLEQILPEHPQDIATTDNLKVGLGLSKQLLYELTPSDAETQITWLNSNPEVVSVSPSGVVTGLQVGTAVVKVQTSNGLRATCIVTVPEPAYRFYIWLRDGDVESYALEEKPLVTMGAELFTLTTTAKTVGYAAKDVLKFTLEDSAIRGVDGDINHDDQFTLDDITTLIFVYLGELDAKKYDADIDGDGKVTVEDITKLINLYLKK